MKEAYELLKMEVVAFQAEDVVVTSGRPDPPPNDGVDEVA